MSCDIFLLPAQRKGIGFYLQRVASSNARVGGERHP